MGKDELDILVDEVDRTEYHRDARTGKWGVVLNALSLVDRGRFIPEGVYITHFIVAEEGVSAVHALAGLLKAAEESRTPVNKEETVRLEGTVLGVMGEARKIVVGSRSLAYADMPLDIGYGQTCSQPFVVAFMADRLELEPGLRVLEVGSGCGYSAAVTSHLIGESGRLVSIEYIPVLSALAVRNLSSHFGHHVELRQAGILKHTNISQDLDSRVLVVQGDGSIGLDCFKPYDRIYLTADAGNGFDPDVLSRQLNPEYGILLYPREGRLVKRVYVYGIVQGMETFEHFNFVPLVGANSANGSAQHS